MQSNTSTDDGVVTTKVVFTHGTEIPQFVHMKHNEPLDVIVQRTLIKWDLTISNPIIRINDDSRIKAVVDETNRYTIIKPGSVLTVQESPASQADKVFRTLTRPGAAPGDVNKALETVRFYSQDAYFVNRFIEELDGLPPFAESIVNHDGKEKNISALNTMMDHNTSLCPWDKLQNSPSFLKVLLDCIQSTDTPQGLLYQCLYLLDNICINSERLYPLVRQLLNLKLCYNHFARADLVDSDSHICDAKLAALKLLNTMIICASEDTFRPLRIKELIDNRISSIITDHIIISRKIAADSELATQLVCMASIILSWSQSTAKSKLDVVDDKHSMETLLYLLNIAFNLDDPKAKPVHMTNVDYYRMLGFENVVEPSEDFQEFPPGTLSLQCMHYFAKTYSNVYKSFILEYSSRPDNNRCPFAKASISVVKILYNRLHIETLSGNFVSKQVASCYKLILSVQYPFEELYCACIQTVNKTWNEMKATAVDFDKVMDVVEEQICMAFEGEKPTVNMEDFKSNLARLTYNYIQSLRQDKVKRKQDLDRKALPVQGLQKSIKTEMLELLKQQRLNYLVCGSEFRQLSLTTSKVLEKEVFLRLSPSHTALQWKQIDERNFNRDSLHTVDFEEIPVRDLESANTELNNPGTKKAIKKYSLVIVVKSDPNKNLRLVTKDAFVYSMWLDGLNILLGVTPTSKLVTDELKKLVELEMSIRLLDLENVELTSIVLPIPALPSQLPDCWRTNIS